MPEDFFNILNQLESGQNPTPPTNVATNDGLSIRTNGLKTTTFGLRPANESYNPINTVSTDNPPKK